MPNSTPTHAVVGDGEERRRGDRATSAEPRNRFRRDRDQSRRRPSRRRSRPRTPPAAESTRLSVSNWRINRARPAPSALRTASSRRRPAPRASSRLATLAQRDQQHERRRRQTARAAPVRTSPTRLLLIGHHARGFALHWCRRARARARCDRASNSRVGLLDGDTAAEPRDRLEVVDLAIRRRVALNRERRRRDVARAPASSSPRRRDARTPPASRR